MSSTFGAPLGGMIRGGQYGLESWARMLIMPSNGAGGFGRYLPSTVVVASGEPGTPVVCWAKAGAAVSISATMNARIVGRTAFVSAYVPPVTSWGERQRAP
jgi:hypothetical protein